VAVPTTLPDVHRVAALTRREAEALAEVLEGLSPDQWARPGCGDWTVDQVTGHMGIVPSSVQPWYEAAIAGEEVEPFDLRDPEFQETQLDMIGEAEPEERIEGIRYAYPTCADYLDSLDAASLDLPTWTPEGVLPLRIAARILLNELYLHGFDIRRAAGLDDRCDTEVAVALLPHTMAILPDVLRAARDLPGTLALVGGERRWTVSPAATGVTVTEGDAPAAATVRLDPRELVLLVWGRISLDEAVSRGATVEGDASLPPAVLNQLDPL
jgi:uncharacterized protein (TIGR03083 family)